MKKFNELYEKVLNEKIDTKVIKAFQELEPYKNNLGDDKVGLERIWDNVLKPTQIKYIILVEDPDKHNPGLDIRDVVKNQNFNIDGYCALHGTRAKLKKHLTWALNMNIKEMKKEWPGLFVKIEAGHAGGIFLRADNGEDILK